MRLLAGLVGLTLTLTIGTAQALEVGMVCETFSSHMRPLLTHKQDQTQPRRQYCTGMYSRNTWGGPVDPFILVKFLGPTASQIEDPIASLIIFEWRDRNLVGIAGPNYQGTQLELCRQDLVEKGHCNSTQLGEYILAPNATAESSVLILTKAVHLKTPEPIHYAIKKTGYYCVLTDQFTADMYEAITEFRNAYGELPATQIPKLPFYGGMTILYALVSVFWGFLYYQHRLDILTVQNYITTILFFLVIEMLMTWGFYDYQNRNGSNLGSKAFLIIVGILNAARNSFSFFLLLIVCMGYGVVKSTLGRTMVHVRWLAAAHFVFGLVYAIASLLVSPESAGPFVLLIVLPLAGTLTAFYVWTLNSLSLTLKDLRERKQKAKESMYKKLWWSILISVIVIFGFFFFNSFTFASVNDPDFVPFHWKTRWFILDGWLNIVYFADVVWIAHLWRPTANNRRFAMSDEIAQDDDGNFEIGDIGVPGDSDDDEETQVGKPRKHEPPVTGFLSTGPEPSASGRPQGCSIPRQSLEGETIFAVGEDGDGLSDDGSEEDAELVPANNK